jgi:hypothetical protein
MPRLHDSADESAEFTFSLPVIKNHYMLFTAVWIGWLILPTMTIQLATKRTELRPARCQRAVAEALSRRQSHEPAKRHCGP